MLFLGTSRAQYAFSTRAVTRYFDEHEIRHYLLGFGYNERDHFPRELIRRLELQPQLVVVNADPFFSGRFTTTAVAERILEGGKAVDFKYSLKRFEQGLHADVCDSGRNGLGALLLCRGNTKTLYRNRSNGHWRTEFYSEATRYPVSYVAPSRPRRNLDHIVKVAESFLAETGIPRQCLVLTVTPSGASDLEFGRRLASRLGTPGIFPQLAGLSTVDHSHLAPDSAERWPQAFLTGLTPHLRRCVTSRGAAPSGTSEPAGPDPPPADSAES